VYPVRVAYSAGCRNLMRRNTALPIAPYGSLCMKKNLLFPLRRLVLILPLICVLGCAKTNPFLKQHADIQTHCAEIKRVSVLPPNVSIYQVSLGGEKRILPEKIQQASEVLARKILDELQKRGFVADPLYSDLQNGIDSEKLFVSQEIQQLYASLEEELQRIPSLNIQKKEFDCTLGDEAKRLSTFAKSDALFFIIFRGYERTGGSIAGETAANLLIAVATMGLVIPPKETSGTELLQAALVDGKSGDIIWTNRVAENYPGFLPPSFDKDSIKNVIDKLFKDFPK
jgi:hypothetical protein